MQGVCKDCGTGTLDNDKVRAFGYRDEGDEAQLVCLYCGSTHVDVYDDEDREDTNESDDGTIDPNPETWDREAQ